MSTSPRIGILGAGGRMGRILIQAVQQAGFQLAAAVERPESSLVGTDAGELAGIGAVGVKVSGSLEAVLADVDVVIDFTAPVATEQHLKICRDAGVAMVIGTTGLSDEQKHKHIRHCHITTMLLNLVLRHGNLTPSRHRTCPEKMIYTIWEN